MRRERGLTLIEVVLVVLVVAALLGLILPALARARGERYQLLCADNLKQLARGMGAYFAWGEQRYYTYPLGRGARPNDYNGAEWLASLYWTWDWAPPDPKLFLCPATDDTNHDGADLGLVSATPAFGPETVSYAGMHYYSQTQADPTSERDRKAGAIRDDFPPNMPMASDDTQGTINHGGWGTPGMNVLFFDAHVEFRTDKDLDIQHGVGMIGGLLWQLRN